MRRPSQEIPMPDNGSWQEALGLIRSLADNSKQTTEGIGKLNERMARLEEKFATLSDDVKALKSSRVTPEEVQKIDARVGDLEKWQQEQTISASYSKGWTAALLAVAGAVGGVVSFLAGHIAEWIKGP